MADEIGFFQRMTALVGWEGPNRSSTPEDDSSAEIGKVYSRSGESFAVPGQYMNRLAQNEDKILIREGAQDLRLYDDLLDDDVAFSCFQQRRLAVVSHDWEVSAGDNDDPRSVEAADHLRLQLKQISWDRICNLMLYSVWHGYAVAECLWKIGSDGKIWLDDVIVPDRRWFAFTERGDLRFSPNYSVFAGQHVPPNKFWTIKTGGNHDFAFYGLGLGHWTYWPIWFKRNVVKFWAVYLEKLGFPTVVGGAESTWSEAEKADFMTALVAIGRDRAVRVPSESMKNIELMEGSRTAAGASGYSDFVTEQNEALMRIILGQPGTSKATAQGIGGSQAQVHEDVKAEIIKADSDLLSESFVPAKWLTRWNFGDDVAPPRVYRILEKAEDVDTIAERDSKLHAIGIRRTEQSVSDIYGEGYELVELTPPALQPFGNPGQLPVAANDDDEEAAELAREAFAATVDDLDLSSGESDAIERIARAMAEETNPILLQFGAALAQSVEGIESAEGMRIALLEAFEAMPVRALAEATALPLLAERLAGNANVEDKVDV